MSGFSKGAEAPAARAHTQTQSAFDLSELCCPLTKKVMVDPVILKDDGVTYEREAIEEWISGGGKNKLTPSGSRLTTGKLIVNVSMLDAIEASGLEARGGGGGGSNLVVPLCAFSDMKDAAKRKNSAEIDKEISKAKGRGSGGAREIKGISKNAFKNLTEGLQVQNHHNNSQIEVEHLSREISDTIIEGDGDQRVMKELSKSGRHVHTTWLNHSLACCMVGGANSKSGSSLSVQGLFNGFEIMSETPLMDTGARAPSKILTMASAADFPDYLVTAGQEKAIRVWRWIESEEEEDDTIRSGVGVGGVGGRAGVEDSPPKNSRSKSFFDNLFDRKPKGSGSRAAKTEVLTATTTNNPSDLGRWVESAFIDVASTNDWINCVKMNSSGSTIFAAGRKGEMSIFRNGAGDSPIGNNWSNKATVMTNSKRNKVSCLEIDSAHCAWAATSDSTVIKIFDVERTGHVNKPVTILGNEFDDAQHKRNITAIGVDGDGVFGPSGLMASGDAKGAILGWDARSRNTAPVRTFSAPPSDAAVIGLSLSGNKMFAASSNGSVIVIDLRTFETLETLSGEDSSSSKYVGVCTTFHETGVSRTVCSTDGILKTWTEEEEEEDEEGWMYNEIKLEGIKVSCCVDVSISASRKKSKSTGEEFVGVVKDG
ncbi:hypothetical protein TrVE_jg4370 [Triparma verrucosa]|uniref:U-box domain-containing protein n=1 Tax=Triparma verrucosa TaxID=1606542 RepID=A0A9W7FPQ5_9STRA|nr:hypothetical protein TrVE_jg4370 [Triparma verrucosa]